MASRQQELQKAEFARHTRELQHHDGSFLAHMKRQLAAASRIQTAWRNRAAPTPPGEPVNDLRLALEAHSELKAHEARSATRKPLRPRN